MTTPWQPFREPVRDTALRTVGIAVVVGVALALASSGRIPWWMGVLLVLWISLGGHFVELWFLNWVRPLLPTARGVQIAARIVAWFVGGIVLSFAMALSARVLTGSWPARQPAWWVGGLAFIGLELLVHVGLQLRGRPSIYDGQG
jgi:hypothetical protein